MKTKQIPIKPCNLCSPKWTALKPAVGVYYCLSCGQRVNMVLRRRRKDES